MENTKKISTNQNVQNKEKRFFRMLYTIFSASNVCFAARVLLSAQKNNNSLPISIIIALIFVGLALYFAYTAFIRKEGFEKSSLLTKIEYAAFVIVILQLILTLTDNPFQY